MPHGARGCRTLVMRRWHCASAGPHMCCGSPGGRCRSRCNGCSRRCGATAKPQGSVTDLAHQLGGAVHDDAKVVGVVRRQAGRLGAQLCDLLRWKWGRYIEDHGASGTMLSSSCQGDTCWRFCNILAQTGTCCRRLLSSRAAGAVTSTKHRDQVFKLADTVAVMLLRRRWWKRSRRTPRPSRWRSGTGSCAPALQRRAAGK